MQHLTTLTAAPADGLTFKVYTTPDDDSRPDYLTEPEDAERLAAWKADRWHYVGVVVEAYAEGVKLAWSSVWAVESDSDEEYLAQLVDECRTDCITSARATLARLAPKLPAETVAADLLAMLKAANHALFVVGKPSAVKAALAGSAALIRKAEGRA